ncbi:MAG: hypothetical protein WC756_07680 [Taibaiella sp.]
MKKIILIFCLAAFPFISEAQQKFTEGIITYNITISGKVPTAANEPALTETKSGTMTISIKGDNIREDIKLEDGYIHSQISNYATGKEIILQAINTIHYAIEINLKDQRKKNTAYYGAEQQTGKGRRNIAGFDAPESIWKYKNGTSLTLYYINAYELDHPEIFDQFPELKGIPAMYDIPMSNGFTTHFELKSIQAEPVDNVTFRVPEGYRIISRKEYDKLLR